MKEIYLILTGGTIAKTYCELKGQMENIPSLKKFLKLNLRMPHVKVIPCELMYKDSNDITEEDRKIILEKLNKVQKKGRSIVVLHGTDKMVKTTKYIKKNMDINKSPIVFTGSMRPMDYINSDAIQNLTEAFYISQYIKPGVYVSFHSKLFDPDDCVKNIEKGRFEELVKIENKVNE